MEKNIDYKQLIQETLSGSEDSFNKLASSVQPLAKFYALSISKDEYIASEATQISTIKMHQSLPTLKDLNSFEGWFKRIVRNTTLDILAKENKEINFSAFDQDLDDDYEYNIADENIEHQPELKFAKEEKEKLILDIVSSLPDTQRTPIMMYFFDEMKIKDIALELSIPESTVKTRLTAGKNNIKSKVEQIQKKDGIKLYSISPLGFFIWLVRSYTADIRSVGTTATALLETNPTISTTAKSSSLLSKISKPIVAKITTGIIVASLVIGGAYIIMNNVNKNTDKTEEKVVKYSVSYKFVSKNGESIPDSISVQLPATALFNEGQTIETPVLNEVDGWTFLGWDLNSITIQENDVVFTGTWQKNEETAQVSNDNSENNEVASTNTGSTTTNAQNNQGSTTNTNPQSKPEEPKGHWEERQVLVRDAWTEEKVIKDAWTENILIKEGWSETIENCLTMGQDYREVAVCNGCGHREDESSFVNGHFIEHKHSYHIELEYFGDVHCLEYATQTINHPAEYETVYHGPVVEQVYHPAEYKTEWVWVEDNQ